MNPHYPSPAELAAFRRAIAAQHRPGFYTYTPAPFGPRQLGDRPWFESQPNGTELAHGIPVENGERGYAPSREIKAANRLRRIEYECIAFELAAGALIDPEPAQWTAALRTFVPDPRP